VNWYVYALCEPDSAEIRYVGLSRNPVKRLGMHYDKPTSEKMSLWLKGLASPPVIKVLSCWADEEPARAEEKRQICARNTNGRLLNTANVEAAEPEQESFSGIGDRVFWRRRFLKMRKVDLSRRTGILESTLSHLESGRRSQIKSDDAVRLARALNTTVEYLVTGEEQSA
jgi:DNA-binding Xre family transcriptional regulator